jgi:hypothetical protein
VYGGRLQAEALTAKKYQVLIVRHNADPSAVLVFDPTHCWSLSKIALTHIGLFNLPIAFEREGRRTEPLKVCSTQEAELQKLHVQSISNKKSWLVAAL